MQAQDVQDVIDLQQILATADTVADRIAALLDWRDRSAADVSLSINPNEPSNATTKPKAKRGKATESSDSDDTFEATPDPSDEPDF